MSRWKPWTLLCLALCASPAHARDPGADGQFDRRAAGHFVLYQDVDIDHRTGATGSKSFERAVLRSLEAAYDALEAMLDVAPRSPITVVVYDPVVFDREFGRALPFPVAGFYLGVIRVRGDTRVTAQLEQVLHHEYAHAAFDAVAPSVGLPALLNEGIAEWFARKSTGAPALTAHEARALGDAAVRDQLLPFSVLLGPNFARFGGAGALEAYTESVAFVDWLVRQRGESGLRDLLRSLFRGAPLDAALERAYGRDLQELEAQFKSGTAR